MRLPLLATLTLLVSHLATAATPDGWTSDLAKAKAEAAATQKDLLLDFTGSDWCTWCIRLRKEVFDTDVFRLSAPKQFVLVELDFPQDASLISPEVRKQNESMQALFGIKGFPTIYLTDASGKPYARTGYEKGGGEAYMQHLTQLREIRLQRDNAFGRAAQLKGLEKAKALKEGLDALGEDLVAVHYKDTVGQIKQLDPQDQLGVDAKFGFSAAMGDLDSALASKQAAGGETLRSVADEFLTKLPKATPRQKQSALMSVLNYLTPPKDNLVALRLLEDVRKLDPESDSAKTAAEIHARVLKMIEAQKAK